MAAIVCPSLGLVEMNRQMFIETYGDSSLSLCLFNNDYTPSYGSLLSDFVQSEINPGSLDGLMLTNPTKVDVPDGAPAAIAWGNLQFIAELGFTPQQIFGYFVVNVGWSPPELMWAQRTDNTFTIATIGDGVSLNPLFQRKTLD